MALKRNLAANLRTGCRLNVGYLELHYSTDVRARSCLWAYVFLALILEKKIRQNLLRHSQK